MKRTTINIKKILIIIIVIFSTFTFSSCKADEENYYKIIEIPRDIEYGILTSDSYVAEGKFYHFTDSIKESLKRDKKVYFSKPDISSLSTNGRVLIENKFYLAATYKNRMFGKDKYVFGFFDVNDKKYHTLHTFKSNDEKCSLSKIGNYLVLSTEDYYFVFNSSNDELVMTIELDKKWVSKVSYSSFMYLTEDEFVIFDSSLHCYEVPVEVNLDDYKSGSNYFFNVLGDTYLRYFDKEHNHIFINYKTLEVEDYGKYVEEKKNNNQSSNNTIEDNINCSISNDTLYITYNGNEYNYSLEHMRKYYSVIPYVERLCNTKIEFLDAFIDNNDIFVSIGNNDSFFGFYTPGRTIPLIFRFNPDSEGFSYVGTSGQIYSNVIKMFPLEDK